MATLTGLFTLGKDAEVRVTQGGDNVATLSLVYNYGKKQDGQQPSQWIRATLWGARAQSLAPYLTKGKQISAVLQDVHMREYESNGKTGTSLEGRIMDLEFTRGKSEGQQQDQGYGGNSSQRQPQRQPQRQAAAPAQQQRAPSGFDDMDSDIPFIDPMRRSLGLYSAI